MTELSPPKPMPVLEFLEGRCKESVGRSIDSVGRSIDNVLAFDDAALERNHDLIQRVFPLPESSRAQPAFTGLDHRTDHLPQDFVDRPSGTANRFGYLGHPHSRSFHLYDFSV